MRAKIKVSYEDNNELLEVIKRLKPIIRSYKVSKRQKGQFKRRI